MKEDFKTDVKQLHSRVVRLEQELRDSRQLQAQATHNPEDFTANLVQSRAYAFNLRSGAPAKVVDECVDSLRRYGFCVIDNVIPANQVSAIRQEVIQAHETISHNMRALKERVGCVGLNLSELQTSKAVELRPVRRVGHLPKPPNDIVWMPRYAESLAHPLMTALARQLLDDHLRIAQLHLRIIQADQPDGTPGGFGQVHQRDRDYRGWHTDWPHDLSAYGVDNPGENVGCIRQPFPDITMCLVMIWYLSDVDENSGGTWVVPGSHRDKRNPMGPHDNIIRTAPIPGEMQVSATAGSVYIQDSRSWHSSPRHNPGGQDRVAVVNRWCPWWLSVDDYAPEGIYNTVCRPLSKAEYQALPTNLQPLMKHLCPEVWDTIQQPVLDRAKAANLRSKWGFRQLEENPESLAQANAHIRVPILPKED